METQARMSYEIQLARFTINDYVRLAILSAAFIALGYLFGLIFTTLFGSGFGVVNAYVQWFFLCLCILIIGKIGTCSIMLLLFSLSVIPVAIWGPPGPHKIGLALAISVVFESILFVLRKRPFLAVLLAAPITILPIPFYILWVNKLMGVPTEKFESLVLKMALVGCVLGLLGAVTAIPVFKKLQKRGITRGPEM
ncbi:MAG: hypothetical protein ACOC6F_01700 [bacterium]